MLPFDVKEPSEETLRKYGMRRDHFFTILNRQGGVCAVCRTVPKSGRLNIDHAHVKGWAKMSADDRIKHVRGLLCYWCNKSHVGRGITEEKSERVTAYLRGHRLSPVLDPQPSGDYSF